MNEKEIRARPPPDTECRRCGFAQRLMKPSGMIQPIPVSYRAVRWDLPCGKFPQGSEETKRQFANLLP